MTHDNERSRGARILVVDDDRDLTETMRIVLEGAGYAVSVANDAEAGQDRVEADRPALILLDVMMPDGTEGFHLVWKLRCRSEAYFQRVPIIVLTAIHDRTDLRFYPESADGTYRAGEYLPVQDFIDKPVEPADLLERVARVLAAWPIA